MLMSNSECKHLKIVNQEMYSDLRGFVRPLRLKKQRELPFSAKDIYISSSRKGVFRGLHVQLSSPPPNKLVSVIQGSIIGVSVCCNTGCKYFGKVTIKKISSNTSKGFLIPSLQAFGYLVLENNTLIATCTDQQYIESQERGINPNSFLNVLDYVGKIVISNKDKKWPTLNDFIRISRDNL
jgi:dTDP-4-dehydrorhamnose 3,5-epimerase